jgi:hypothetical protein
MLAAREDDISWIKDKQEELDKENLDKSKAPSK